MQTDTTLDKTTTDNRHAELRTTNGCETKLDEEESRRTTSGQKTRDSLESQTPGLEEDSLVNEGGYTPIQIFIGVCGWYHCGTTNNNVIQTTQHGTAVVQKFFSFRLPLRECNGDENDPVAGGIASHSLAISQTKQEQSEGWGLRRPLHPSHHSGVCVVCCNRHLTPHWWEGAQGGETS